MKASTGVRRASVVCAAADSFYSSGNGTIFSITPSGTERTLHVFEGAGDGARGTTGNGTVFSITPAGKERMLHAFQGAPNDGQLVLGGLTVLNGTLYGTTDAGGANGTGTVFALTP
ncbi:MAG: choice-of-anchor tandem repeat GloVer-containing protein [Candidatus Cybelea sp.]